MLKPGEVAIRNGNYKNQNCLEGRKILFFHQLMKYFLADYLIV